MSLGGTNFWAEPESLFEFPRRSTLSQLSRGGSMRALSLGIALLLSACSERSTAPSHRSVQTITVDRAAVQRLRMRLPDAALLTSQAASLPRMSESAIRQAMHAGAGK
jgi:hypothetical protein